MPAYLPHIIPRAGHLHEDLDQSLATIVRSLIQGILDLDHGIRPLGQRPARTDVGHGAGGEGLRLGPCKRLKSHGVNARPIDSPDGIPVLR